jgi:dTDP-4-amino-4,6-dideoxygalactose transaminase
MRAATFPNAERAAQEVLSLTMHPFLTTADQDRIVEALIQTSSHRARSVQ